MDAIVMNFFFLIVAASCKREASCMIGRQCGAINVDFVFLPALAVCVSHLSAKSFQDADVQRRGGH